MHTCKHTLPKCHELQLIIVSQVFEGETYPITMTRNKAVTIRKVTDIEQPMIDTTVRALLSTSCKVNQSPTLN